MDKEALKVSLTVALATLAAGGLMLYFAGARPRSSVLSREIIPVNEPTLFDWIDAGGALVMIN